MNHLSNILIDMCGAIPPNLTVSQRHEHDSTTHVHYFTVKTFSRVLVMIEKPNFYTIL
jgi:hypothetical protein